jgi:hypothetical protein
MKSIPGNFFGLLLAGGLRAELLAGINPRRRQKECAAAKTGTLKRESTVVMIVVDDGGHVILMTGTRRPSRRACSAPGAMHFRPGPDYRRLEGLRRHWSERKRPTKR